MTIGYFISGKTIPYHNFFLTKNCVSGFSPPWDFSPDLDRIGRRSGGLSRISASSQKKGNLIGVTEYILFVTAPFDSLSSNEEYLTGFPLFNPHSSILYSAPIKNVVLFVIPHPRAAGPDAADGSLPRYAPRKRASGPSYFGTCLLFFSSI